MNGVKIHESAIVDDNCSNWERQPCLALCSYLLETQLAKMTVRLRAKRFREADVSIGNNCRFRTNVSVYDAVVLEDDVFLWSEHGFSPMYTTLAQP